MQLRENWNWSGFTIGKHRLKLELSLKVGDMEISLLSDNKFKI